jgi:transposase, IS5 family
MRQLFQEQPSLIPMVEHRHAEELAEIDRILLDNPAITERVLQDLQAGVIPDEGRKGMTAEGVLRAALLKQMNDWSYDELCFHLADSTTYRWFAGLGWGEAAPSRSTLQRNVKRITEETWQAINRTLLGYARDLRVESGRKVRVDATVTETNIHHPTDSSLLWDSVRVLTRLMADASERFEVDRFPNRTRRAKRRAMGVLNARRRRKRTKAYRDLLKVTRETVGYAEQAALQLEGKADVMAQLSAVKIRRYVALAERVIDQTGRRVLHGEQVPAGEKLVSIFEEHTDIIVKDRRDTLYGHKLTLTREAPDSSWTGWSRTATRRTPHSPLA